MSLAGLTPEQVEQLANATFSSNKPLNFGPFILGSVVDALLCGILLMQCGSYVSSGARDGWLPRVAIACVMAMNLWGTVLTWVWVWELFVRNFGIYRTFFSVTYLSWTSVINTGNSVLVQIFFALRAWKMLNQSRLFAIVLIGLLLAIVGSGIALRILFARYQYTIDIYRMKVPAYTCLWCLVAGDVLIASTILWYILGWRGLPPTLFAIALLSVYTIQYDSFILVALIWIHPKLHTISLLHTLNMRSEMARPEVVFGTYTAPSSGGPQPPVATTQIARAEQFDVTSHNNAVGAVQSRSYLSTQNEPRKPAVISFDLDGVVTTSGDIPKTDAMSVVSHNKSFDTDMEVVERKSKPPDLDSYTNTAG